MLDLNNVPQEETLERLFASEFLESYAEYRNCWVLVDYIFKTASGKGFMLVGHNLITKDGVFEGEIPVDTEVSEFIFANTPLGKALTGAFKTQEPISPPLAFKLQGLKKVVWMPVPQIPLECQYDLTGEYAKAVWDWDSTPESQAVEEPAPKPGKKSKA